MTTNDGKPMVIVKWKYRDCRPGEDGATIDGYIDYIEDQVDDRRENGGYLVEEGDFFIGDTKQDEKRLKEALNTSDSEAWNKAVYLNYINERKGSSSCFSNLGADVEELKEQVKQHDGAIWIPIVSMKEDVAKELGLDTEAAWMAKAMELAEDYRKELGIPKENFRWLAAFHSKEQADQNPDADAGSMPHLHFMLWEADPQITKYALKTEKIDKIRERTANIMTKEYMERFYEERNKLKEQLRQESLNSIDRFAQDIKKLIVDLRITMPDGKLNVGEIEKRRNIALRLLDKYEVNKELDKKEEYFVKKLDLDSAAACKRAIRNYNNVLDELDRISADILSDDKTIRLVEAWYEASKNMRKAQGEELAEKITRSDLQEIQKGIKNAILNEVKKADNDKSIIAPSFRAMLLEKLDEGTLKTSTRDDFENTVSVITELCKTVGMSQFEAMKKQEELLERSQKEEYEEYLAEIVDKVYNSYKKGFNVTSKDFWEAMRQMRVPVPKQEASVVNLTTNDYEIVSNVVLQPIQAVAVQSLEKAPDILKEEIAKGILDINLAKLTSIPLTLSDYEDKYNTMLDYYSEIGQTDFERDPDARNILELTI